jgi:hypothetical protein
VHCANSLLFPLSLALCSWGFLSLRLVSAFSYVARQMCSCIYVQNRDETACLAEIGPQIKGAQIVYMEERVIVNYSGLNQAEARLKPGYGCNVQDFIGSMPSGVLNGTTYND